MCVRLRVGAECHSPRRVRSWRRQPLARPFVENWPCAHLSGAFGRNLTRRFLSFLISKLLLSDAGTECLRVDWLFSAEWACGKERRKGAYSRGPLPQWVCDLETTGVLVNTSNRRRSVAPERSASASVSSAHDRWSVRFLPKQSVLVCRACLGR